MFCHICGTRLPDLASFCPGCGRSLEDHPLVLRRSNASAEAAADSGDPIPAEAAQVLPSDAPAGQISEPIPEEAAAEPDLSPVPEDPEPAPGPVPELPVRKRRPALIPALIMTGLLLAGLCVFFRFPFTNTEFPNGTAPGVQENDVPPLPNRDTDEDAGSYAFVPTDDDCFQMDSGAVSFLPEKYSGGAVLVIPSQIDGQTVTSIDNSGFAGMQGITTVILPDSLETIEDNAFEGCTDLRGIYVPSSVTSIGRRAFFGCVSLESLSIPEETVSIGTNAFDGCASLMYIFYEGTYEDWIELYNEYVTPFTYACCADGEYYHGAYMP